MKLEGKTALVTGASKGVGRAIAEALRSKGARVIGTTRDVRVADWPQGVEKAQLELCDSKQIETFWQEQGFDVQAPDVLVNNAGSGVFGDFAELAFEDWKQQADLMLLAPMQLSRLALKSWGSEREGIVVNVGSLAVEYPIPFLSGYNAAKAGLAAFTESLQYELVSTKARIIELRLGDVNTGFNAAVRGRPRNERQEASWKKMEEHVAKSPSPGEVAAKLLDALSNDRIGVVYAGSFFQVVLASKFGRICSQGFRRLINSWYYNLGRD